MATFVLNDENVVNCYGFRIRNAGIDLARFKANPVMLDDHQNSTDAVLGRWKNIRVEGAFLKADDDFDVEDDRAKRIQGKVERGMIRGCSLGISFDPANMERQPDGSYDLMKCEVGEASIVAVPGNANALRLYAADGSLMTEEAVKLSLSALSPNNTNPSFSKTDTPKPAMKKLLLSFTALQLMGFTKPLDEGDEAAAARGIETMATDLTAAKTENATLKAEKEKLEKQLSETQKAVSKGMLDRAVLSGQILETERPHYEALATTNMDLCIATLAKLPAKITLSDQVTSPAGGATEVKTMEDFQKLTTEQQLAFKASNPAGYKKIVE